MPFDEDPSDTRSELDMCIDEIKELQQQLVLVEKQCQENGHAAAEKTLEIDGLKTKLLSAVEACRRYVRIYKTLNEEMGRKPTSISYMMFKEIVDENEDLK